MIQIQVLLTELKNPKNPGIQPIDSAGDGMGPCLDINECDSNQANTISTMGVSVKRTSNNCDKQTTECFNLDMDSKM